MNYIQHIQHNLDAIIIASIGVISLIWLGRNIYMAMRDIQREAKIEKKISLVN